MVKGKMRDVHLLELAIWLMGRWKMQDVHLLELVD